MVKRNTPDWQISAFDKDKKRQIFITKNRDGT